MKVARNLAKVRRALEAAGKLERAVYIERATMGDAGDPAGERRTTGRHTSRSCWCRGGRGGRERTARPSSGSGREPGPDDREARRRSRRTGDLFGYAPYLARLALRGARTRTRSDNREELARAPRRRWRWRRRARGWRWSRAATRGSSRWRQRSARRSRRAGGVARARGRGGAGMTAMLAVAARVGAPLGHDFCALSLSDNLKPWDGGRGAAATRRRAAGS